MRLEERGRNGPRWVAGPLGVSSAWDDVVGRGDLLTICAASMHPDGYLRERASRLLADREESLVARCLALRAVDHVPQVRRVALPALVQRPDPAALALLLRMRKRVHGPAALAAYGELFDTRELLGASDPLVRRFAYEQELAGMDSSEVEMRLGTETDQWLRRRLAERWMAVDPALAKGQLVGSRYVEGRLMVLLDGTDDLFERGELEERMLDRSRRVRAAACWRYRRAGYDPASYYRARWEADGVDAALDGLRETGQRFDAVEAQRALASDDQRLRVAALRLWPEGGPPKELLLTLLADPSSAVVKHAARLLAATPGIRYDDVLAAAVSEEPNQRRAAWRLRRELGGWNRLRADLEALQDPDEKLLLAAKQDLAIWLEFRAANTYQPLLPSEREAIRAHLDRVDLPRGVVDLLKFHTGLR